MFQILKEFYLYYFLKINIWWRISVLVVIIVLSAAMYHHYKKHLVSKIRAVSVVILISWSWFVLVSTAFGRVKLYGTPQYNMDVFWQYYGMLFSDTLYVKLVYARGIGYNILMLLPVGVLFPIATKYQNIWIIFLIGILLSIAIECFQLVTMRGLFETGDILNNVIGVLIGYGIYRGIGMRWLDKVCD